MQEGNKHPAPEVQAPGRDKDGFPIKEVEEIKRLGAQRVDSPHGVFYRMPMRALYPENPNIPESQNIQLSQETDVQFQEIARCYDIAKRILALIPQGASPKVKSCAIDLICALLESVVEELVNHDISEQ